MSSDKTRLFALSVGTYLDIICNVFNEQGIRQLIDLNGDKFKGISDYPKMVHGDVEDANLDKFGNFISMMVRSGVIVPDEELEKFSRNMANIPQADGYEYKRPEAKGEERERNRQQETSDEPEAEPETTGEDGLIAERAMKSLGR